MGYWAGVVTLLIGWSLKEFSDWLRLRREQRRPFARVIAELLEIRHRLLGVRTACVEIKKRSPITDDVEVALRTVLHGILPQTEDLQGRYNGAVSLVAGTDPIPAFRLRCKDEFSPFMQKFRPLLAGDAVIGPLAVQIEDTLSDGLIRNVEALAVELAWAHGVLTWWKIRARLSKSPNVPGEFDELFRLVEKNQQPSTTSP